MSQSKKFIGKNVLVFGGFGFLGSNLGRHFLSLGADVTLVDHRKTKKNKKLFKNSKNVQGDILKTRFLNRIVKDQDIILQFAGHSGPLASLKKPFLDLEVNCRGMLNVFEACRRFNPEATIIIPGSRLEFGKIIKNPVDENCPIEPTSIYGIHRAAITRYARLYHQIYNLKTIVLRLSNPYGPHPVSHLSTHNIINWFIDQSLKGKDLPVYGQGKQLRDYLYVDDAAQAIIKACLAPKALGQVINIGGGKGISFLQMAKYIIKEVGRGKIKKVPWPDDYHLIETGDYVTDITKAKEILNWEPKVDFILGIKKTIASQKK